jgi:predicted Zn-dependent protease
MTKTKHYRLRYLVTIASVLAVLCLAPSPAHAQSDVVFKYKKSGGTTRVSGSITEITPLGVTVKTNNGPEQIPAGSIKKIATKNDPNGLDRARDRIDDGRFDDGLEQLQKLDTGSNPIVVAEVAYLKAFASAKIALNGGSITAQQAGSAMQKFIKNHGKSHHFVPATELMGHLAVAAGSKNLDFGKGQFALLTKSNWPEYVLKGFFYQGETMLKQGKFAEAAQSYDQILASEANDNLTQQYKLLAKCEKAKAEGLAGQTEPALQVINGIIRDENPDNTQLFAYAYNARGAVQLKANQLKEARESFLFTDLLFSSETEPHAEAVFNLAKIWQQLEKTDRSNESRETLKGRYRNSYWSTQL